MKTIIRVILIVGIISCFLVCGLTANAEQKGENRKGLAITTPMGEVSFIEENQIGIVERDGAPTIHSEHDAGLDASRGIDCCPQARSFGREVAIEEYGFFGGTPGGKGGGAGDDEGEPGAGDDKGEPGVGDDEGRPGAGDDEGEPGAGDDEDKLIVDDDDSDWRESPEDDINISSSSDQANS